eukprot:GHVO01017069.1.p1 GENE.GHVO01017069.1~~GHVO01017069.1.p1  ORF type:complete len:488 (+),score=121.94 GHVO01017069.1:337-1800(+)
MTATYWNEVLSDPTRHVPSITSRELTRQDYIVSNADVMETVKELIMMGCDAESRKFVAPLIKYPSLCRMLYSLVSHLETEEEQAAHLQGLLSDRTSEVRTRLEGFAADRGGDDDTKAGHEMDLNTSMQAKASPIVDSTGVDTGMDVTVDDIPMEERQRRMAKGEILPRDEWLPGQGKKPLNHATASEHLAWGTRLLKEGTEAYQSKRLDTALMRYTQGVRLLESVEGEEEDDNRLILDMIGKFYKNRALAAMGLGKWTEARDACTLALEIDAHDSKARYRRGSAHIGLGDLKEAKDDYIYILKDPHSAPHARLAAKTGFQNIRSIVIKWRRDCKGIIKAVSEESVFSNDRASIEKQEKHGHTAPRIQPHKEKKIEDDRTEYAPPLSLADTKSMLIDLLVEYSTDDFSFKIAEQKRMAEYDERRIILRARKLVPAVAGPVLRKWGFSDESYWVNQKEAEKCVGHWKEHDQDIVQLSQEIRDIVVGDCF